MLRGILAGQVTLTEVVAVLIALVLGISVHEFAHAAAATWLGDTLPQRQGRLTLAPAAHLDVMGSLMFLVAGFGWGKPVQYNPYALRAGPRSGPTLVSLAGPVSNLILAVLVAILFHGVAFLAPRLGVLNSAASSTAFETALNLLALIVLYNLFLGFFNLIPVFPLDGFTILLGILPPELADQFEQTRQWGFFVLLLLIFVGGGIMNVILYQPVEALLRLLLAGV